MTHASIALAVASFDTAFRHLMETVEALPNETPDQRVAGVYAQLFAMMVHRDSIVGEKEAIIAMSTVSGMVAEAIGGPPLVRQCLLSIRQGSMVQYQQGLRSAKADTDTKH